jgi:hypothetical protein
MTCGGSGCAYCEGWFLSEEEKNFSPVRKEPVFRKREEPDYELLQLQKQNDLYTF